MSLVEDVIGCLQEKTRLLSEVEKITESMAVVPQEDLLGCTEKRGKLIDEIKLLDDKLREFASMNNEIRSVLNNACEKSDLTEEIRGKKGQVQGLE